MSVRRRPAAGSWRVLVVAAALAAAPAAAEPAAVRIGVVVDGPWEGNQAVLDLTVAEVTALTAGEFEVGFPAAAHLIGDWTFDTARANLERLLADPGVDLVITWGLLASHAVCCVGELDKPVVAPVVADPFLQGLPLAGGASGVPNLSYVALENATARELALFQRIVPFSKITFLSTREFLEAVPDVPLRSLELAARAGLEADFVGLGSDPEEALAAIPGSTEAVYVWPQFQMGEEGFRRLVDGLNARKLPSFSALGGRYVEAGMLATAQSDDFFQRLSRRVALNVQRILLGEPPASIPVDFRYRERLAINMATARAIGVSPGWDVLVEARLLHAEESGLPALTLERAVEQALADNPELAAARRELAAGEQQVAAARAALRPRLELSGSALAIDDDRAAASFGSQPERTTLGSLALGQLVFSEPARANLEIERRLQAGREADFESRRLDLVRETAVVYLNLLRAKTLVEVQRNNLELTRSNLELAELRRAIGAANPAEVYRWQSRIATDRKALIEAQASRRIAEIALNRLLGRDLEEQFLTEEVDLEDPDLITGQERFRGYTTTPRRFRLLRDFMVEEGLTAAPELRRLDRAIAAQERARAAARRAFWLPAIGLRAGVDQRLSAAGAGSAGGPVLPGLALPRADDTSWSLGLSASLPLFAGGERRAEVERAEAELDRLGLAFDATADRIEQRIRSGIEVARASFAGIELSREASAAARSSLELVADAYARGAVSILDLLDVQNAALNAELLAANAVYDFFVDLMEVQRAASRFDFFLDIGARDLWYQRLELYFDRAGHSPGESTR